jgi:hypothetical protein
MPESRHRHKHHHHHVQVHHAPVKSKRSAAGVLAILAAILGLAVAYFTQGVDVLWIIVGIVSGAIIGYFIGHSMDKTLQKTNK